MGAERTSGEGGFRPFLPDVRYGEQREVLELFCTVTARDLDELAKAVAADSAAEVRRLAHRIKGAAATIGANEMLSVAAWLETHAGGPFRDQRREVLHLLKDGLRQVQDYLGQLNGDGPGSVPSANPGAGGGTPGG